MQLMNEIMECDRPKGADSVGMSILIYTMVFYIQAEETAVMEGARA